MDLGEKLFQLRKTKNLTQDDVAEKLNVSRQTISKWETNQSTPDFDKIVPLCELFEIGVEELLTGKKPEPVEEKKKENVLTRQEVKEKSAKVVSTSVFLYISSVVVLIVATSIGINPVIATGIFLLIIAWATARIVYHYMSKPKFDQTEEEIQKDEKQNTLQKQINEIIMTIATTIYFLLSFLTMAWHITWIIFIIASLICQVVKLIFLLKGDKENEE